MKPPSEKTPHINACIRAATLICYSLAHEEYGDDGAGDDDE